MFPVVYFGCKQRNFYVKLKNNCYKKNKCCNKCKHSHFLIVIDSIKIYATLYFYCKLIVVGKCRKDGMAMYFSSFFK